jgi:cell division protein FtsL
MQINEILSTVVYQANEARKASEERDMAIAERDRALAELADLKAKLAPLADAPPER